LFNDTSKTAKIILFFFLVLYWAMNVINDFYYIHGQWRTRKNQMIFAVFLQFWPSTLQGSNAPNGLAGALYPPPLRKCENWH